MPVRVETCASVDEAARALSANRGARVFGGGTLLMRALNEADPAVSVLVRVTDPALRRIDIQGDRIAIGAGVTMDDILHNRDLAFLHGAARAVGSPAVRSAATAGGNIFAPAPYGEFANALLALGASVRFAGGGSEQGIEDVLRGRERDPGRLVTAVICPRPADADAFRFAKITRVKPKGVAVMSIAVLAPRGGRGGWRVSFANMGPTPMRAIAAERALEGASLDDAGLTRALANATEGLNPADDEVATAWYRREVAPVHLKRLILGRN